MPADLETVQQLARAHGMRVRIKCDDTAESRTFTLVDSADRPTSLADVTLATIAQELAKERAWFEPPPAWQTLVPRLPPRSKPTQQPRTRPLQEQWHGMRVQALARFDRDGPPFNCAEFARSLQNWCLHKYGHAPRDHRQVCKKIRVWLEHWRVLHAAERTSVYRRNIDDPLPRAAGPIT